MNKNIIEALKESRFAGGLAEEYLKKLADIAKFSKCNSRKYIFFHNQEAHGFYLIVSGEVKIFIIGNDGREQIIHRLSNGETFGEVAVFQGKSFPATAVTATNSELLFFPRNSFLAISRKNPELLLNIIAILSAHLRKMVDMIDDLSLKGIEARLAKFLLKNKTSVIRLKVSKTELSAQLGTIPATLSRTLKKLQAKEAILVSGNSIEVLNKETLENIAEYG